MQILVPLNSGPAGLGSFNDYWLMVMNLLRRATASSRVQLPGSGA
jgi:hypothetical protein